MNLLNGPGVKPDLRRGQGEPFVRNAFDAHLVVLNQVAHILDRESRLSRHLAWTEAERLAGEQRREARWPNGLRGGLWRMRLRCWTGGGGRLGRRGL